MDLTAKINGYFPYHEVSPTEKKSFEYILKCNNFIDGAQDSISDGFKKEVRQNRLYVEAIQDTEIYMERFGLKRGLNKEFVDYSDLNFSPIGIPRVIFNALYSKLNSINSINRVECRDEFSATLKQDKIIEFRTKAKLAEPIKEITGIDIKGDEYVPENEIELDVYQRMGGIATAVEITLQELLKEIDEQNKYSMFINPEINYEIICSGLPAIHLEYAEDGKIIETPIDITKLKVLGGSKRDYSDASAFRLETTMPTQEVINLMRSSLLTNDYVDLETSIKRVRAASKDDCSNIHVYYWQCYDTYTKSIKEKNGMRVVRNRDNNKDGIKTNVHKWYKSYRVQGTDVIFNAGEMPNIVRTACNTTEKKAQCPIIILRVKPYRNAVNTSIISVIKKFEDMAVMAWLKLQNELANAKPSGREYNLTAIANAIELVDFKDLDEALDYAEQTGNIYTAQKDSWDQPSGGAAFREIRGGLTGAFSDYMDIIKFTKEFAHEISGITTIDTGAIQNPKISNFVTKGAIAGTDKAIVELLETKLFFLQLSGEKKINMVLKYGHPNCKIPYPYKTQFSEVKEFILNLIRKSTAMDIGLRIEQDLTEDEQNQLISEMIALSQNYRDGNGNAGITPIELIHFKDMVKNGNSKFAAYMLGVLQEKRQKDRLQEQQMSVQQNAQVQQQSNEMAINGKLQAENQKLQGQLEKVKLEKDLELRNEMTLKTAELQQDQQN
ncbi:MAG: hypothetical protein U0T69_11150 [Chitinophagales bacterium]